MWLYMWLQEYGNMRIRVWLYLCCVCKMCVHVPKLLLNIYKD